MFSFQVDLALDVESALPGIMRKYFMVMCETIKPNRQVMGLKRILHMESSNLSAQSIAGALNPELVSQLSLSLFPVIATLYRSLFHCQYHPSDNRAKS